VRVRKWGGRPLYIGTYVTNVCSERTWYYPGTGYFKEQTSNPQCNKFVSFRSGRLFTPKHLQAQPHYTTYNFYSQLQHKANFTLPRLSAVLHKLALWVFRNETCTWKKPAWNALIFAYIMWRDISSFIVYLFNHLKTKRRPLYLKTQSVPRCKHFSSLL